MEDCKEHTYPVWNLLKELHAQGKLTPEQTVLCTPTMPKEELYDLKTNPHQIRSLARLPEHEETLKRLRAALERWIEETNDQGQSMEPPEVVARRGREGCPKWVTDRRWRAGPAPPLAPLEGALGSSPAAVVGMRLLPSSRTLALER
ncbi:MAG: hypothetical protein COZ06_30370 [Armatimonadetes bacterium CG_4_10_14_3_um_filter_66_18]|nr:hypothetical protein [Armatimonadota bacterium]OIP07952.1 MAG: hypothetical protein AUJ96_06625 [Armatimonadetes bacterium CG2_30_66_41]PIU92917.1 MAG: hypothetical protein COS65_15500 [Armatimonadetes bacterium CG06_land_8_20_14_3_00_66_21]PIX39116.1 MAG: hypothetical protein COZ57_28860 [Armatimonadetes bacterium CG_4_8_14_3_um_filter_66_20]PIY39027.1 MAG: hypothetical protein COZ06_30370 [Armatimonadetes bacterium CG_4_10_14_3_um_filter_66_18]PIZ42973.1 MAG: hypothetical protein COY42_16